jgi:hypothetical protein
MSKTTLRKNTKKNSDSETLFTIPISGCMRTLDTYMRTFKLVILLDSVAKPSTKDGKEDVFEVVPHIEMGNHLGIGYGQELWRGHVNFIDLSL